MLQDLKLALRSFLKTPGFTLVAVLTLALGIGANTAVFSLVNEVLLRSLPVRHPEELVLFRAISGAKGGMSRSEEGNSSYDAKTGRSSGTSFSLLAFERFQKAGAPLADVFAFAPIYQLHTLVDGEAITGVEAQFVSGNYHAALGVNTVLGRTLLPADDQTSAPPVAVISDRFWRSQFGGDPDVLGKVVRLNRVAVTIVGVTSAGFAGAAQVGEPVDISLPFALHSQVSPSDGERAQPWFWWARIMGRVTPGATAEQARAVLEPVYQQVALEGWKIAQSLESTVSEQPDAPTLGVDSGARGENDQREDYAQTMRLMMGLVILVLLAACANIANLLLARGAARRREVAVRLALGATRGRIARQLFAEALLLAGLGTVVGLALAWWGRDLLLALHPFGGSNVVLDLPLDSSVLTFTVAAAAGTALLFGLAPAWRASRLDLTAEFQGGTRQLGAGSRSRLSQGLMVLQIALSLVLLVSTGLFLRTLRNLHAVDAGFNRARLAVFRVNAATAGYSATKFTDLQERILRRLERIPGVQAATYSNLALLARSRWTSTIAVPGFTPKPGESMNVHMNALAPNFFTAMEMPIVTGRGFTARDDAAAPKVAVVNQTFAKKYFGDQNPIGQHFGSPRDKTGGFEIIGVSRDAKYTALRDAIQPTAYVCALQQPNGPANYAVRAVGDPAALLPAIRAALREIDPTLPLISLRTQEQLDARVHWQELLFARLSGAFGLLALVLSSVGLFGLMSYIVLQRTGEIGLRMALGALPGNVLTMIVRESLGLVIAGVLLGAGIALAAGRLVTSMLFGLSPTDPVTYFTAAAILGAVAVVAVLLPARRAAQIDPMEALRAD